MSDWIITEHAIDRWRERRKIKRTNRKWISNKISEALKERIWLSKELWYAKGLVFVLVGWRVVTCYKPKEQWIQRRIWQAIQERKLEHSNQECIDFS